MKRFFNIGLLFGLVCSIVACSHLSEKFEHEIPADAVGTMKLVSPLVSVESRAVNSANFIVRILKGTEVVSEYTSFSKMPEIIT